jgi:hypothetical protein
VSSTEIPKAILNTRIVDDLYAKKEVEIMTV